MKQSGAKGEPGRPHKALRVAGMILVVLAAVVGLRIAFDGGEGEAGAGIWDLGASLHGAGGRNDEAVVSGRGRNDETVVSGSHRQPLQFRAKAVEPEAVLGVLATGSQTVDERVRQLQGMRGISLSKEEREAALAFLAGKDWPEGMGKGSAHWLADELLTTLRLQEPPWDGLAAELGKAAFQPDSDPVVRDYIMQHLGHLWEQYGARGEIEESLWRALGTADETTPGTALIALSRGYGRDQQEQSLAKARQQALVLARDANTPLAVRVTALSIAGDGGGNEVKELATELVRNAQTPVILRKVAERVVGP